jgi:hypothetical protein
MKIDAASLEELKQVCAELFQRNLSDSELQEIGQRIIRFLESSEGFSPPRVRYVDAD